MVAWAQIFVGLVGAATPPGSTGGLELYGGGNLQLYAGGNLELYGSVPSLDLYGGGSLDLYGGGSLALYLTAGGPAPDGALLDLNDVAVLDLEDEFILPPA